MTANQPTITPSLKSITHRMILVLFLLTAVTATHAQGCSQCRETIGQTNPQTQKAYRRGIIVLVVAASAVFTGAYLALRRFR